MAHDLFTDVSSPTVRFRSSPRWTLPISIVAHVAIIALVVIIPLMATDVLPRPDTGRLNFMPAMPTPPMPPAPPATAPRPATKPIEVINPNAAPISAPDKIADEIPSTGPVVPGSVDFSGAGPGVVGGVDFAPPVAAAPEPPAPPAPTRPFRVGGAIRQPVRIRGVAPTYPAIAQSARVSGTVVIEAVIDIDGSVRDARVLSGAPLLNGAALDAVRQWRYTPTLLNNQPVQVLMTVRVEFNLQ